MGKGMLGVYIHKVRLFDGSTDIKGGSPFDKWTFSAPNGKVITYPTYDWVDDDGRANLGSWIENAAKMAGR